MLSRSVRWAYVLSVIVPLLFSYVALRDIDDAFIAEATHIVTVTDTPKRVSSERMYQGLTGLAREAELNLAREVTDRSNPERSRHLYVAVGDPSSAPATWGSAGYPSFDPAMSTSIAPFARLGRMDVPGSYLVFDDTADGAKSARVVAAFEEHGFAAAATPVGSLLDRALFASDGVVIGGMIVAATLVAALGAVGTLNALRRSAVERLSGLSIRDRVVRRTCGAIRTLAPWTVAYGVSAAALYAHNGLHQWSSYVTISITLTAASLGVVAVTQTLSEVLITRSRIGSGLRGARPTRAVLVALLAVRIPALLLLLSTASTAAVSNVRLESFAADGNVRHAARESVKVSVGGVTSGPIEQTWPRAEQFVRKAEAAHRAVVTSPQDLQSLTSRRIPVHAPVLVVNDVYLAEQPVHDRNGSRVHGSNDLQVLVPDRLEAERELVTTVIHAWVRFLLDDAAPAPAARTRASAQGQRLYTYATPDRPGRTWMDDPIVIVLPTLAGARVTDVLASWMTTGDLVFADPVWVNTTIDRDGLQDVLIAVQPVAQAAADEEHRLASDLRLAVIDTCAAAAVLAIVTIASITTSRRRSASALFIRNAVGWSMTRANAGALALEFVIAVGAAVVALRTFETRKPDAQGWNSPLDPVVASSGDAFALALVLTVSALVLGVVTTLRSARRAVRSEAKDG